MAREHWIFSHGSRTEREWYIRHRFGITLFEGDKQKVLADIQWRKKYGWACRFDDGCSDAVVACLLSRLRGVGALESPPPFEPELAINLNGRIAKVARSKISKTNLYIQPIDLVAMIVGPRTKRKEA